MTEEWKPIAGYEGLYEVSNLGRVRSLDRRTHRGRRVYGRTMVPQPNTNGYLAVMLSKAAVVKRHMVHTLVLTTFVGARPDGQEACHNNGDALDNRAENLRWDTKAANHADKRRHGTNGADARNSMARLSDADVEEIRRLRMAGGLLRHIAREFGVTEGHVSDICAGKKRAQSGVGNERP